MVQPVARNQARIGLGGRLDAVNAIEPDAGLITSIGLDHQDWLGDTLDEITREKAGIMRRGKPTVFSAIERPAVIDDVAEATGAVLLAAGRDFAVEARNDRWNWNGSDVSLDGLLLPGLRGDFQLANAAGVLAVLEAAGFSDLLDRERVSLALANVSVRGRMQRFADSHRWLFDVAHNPAAAAALAATLAASDRPLKRVALVGMLDNKDVDGVVTPLDAHVDEWIAVTAEGARGLTAAELGRRIANATNRHCLCVEEIVPAVAEARRSAGTGGEILVLGSFHTVGPVQEVLGL